MRQVREKLNLLPKLQELAESRSLGGESCGPFKSSLRTTIMCWFLVVSLVPVISISLVGHQNAVQKRVEDISGRLQSASLMEKLDLEKYYGDLQYQAASKAQLSGLKTLAGNGYSETSFGKIFDDAHAELLDLRDRTSSLNVLLLDLDTKVVLSCDHLVENGTNWVETHGVGSKLEKTFAQVKTSGKAAFSGFVTPGNHSKSTHAYHIEPVIDDENSIAGFILLKLGGGSFYTGSGRYELVGRGVRFYAFNEELDLLATNLEDSGLRPLVSSVLTENAVRWKDKIGAFRSHKRFDQSPEFGVQRYVGVQGEDVFGVLQDLEIMGTHVGLVSEIPSRDILAGLKRMDYTLLGLILLVTLLVVLAGMVVSSRLVAPINHLGQVMQRVSDGHEVWTLPDRGPQEVRRLNDMFHFMINKLSSAQELNQRQFALQRNQFDLNDKLRGESSLEEMAKAGLDYLVNHYSAQMGVFYLLESKDVLRKAASYGVVDSEKRIPEIRLAEGVIGQCALEKKIRVLKGIQDDRHGVETGLVKSSVTNLILAPIHLEGRVLGVLELGILSEVKEEDLDLLHLVRENIAVAINAARSRERVNRLLKETWSQTTALSKQQRELKESNHQLEVADQYKSEFLTNMSHELRTPLNSMLIMSQVLGENRDENLSRSEVDAALTINKAGSDLLLLINDILDLSKVEAGKLELCFESVELKSIIADMDDLFSPLAHKQELEFRALQGPQLPLSITSDALRLTQILKNILNNAFKFTNEGSVTFRVRCTAPGEMAELDVDSNVPWVVFSVSDTGTGMNRKTLARIFEAFNQGDGSIGRPHGGSGLGLSISRKLSTLLDGVIRVESIEGKGSTFRLFLPVKPSEEVLKKQDKESSPEPIIGQLSSIDGAKINLIKEQQNDDVSDPDQSTVASEELFLPPDLEGRQILICDDDMRMVFRISEIVDELGAKVTLAHSWKQGVAKCHDGGEFDIGIVSHRLPDRPENGNINAWKAACGDPSFPVLTLVKEDDEQESTGANLVGNRPLQEDEFLEMLKTVLDPDWILKTKLSHL